MSVTLKDIATELNISTNAVSRALRDKSDISPETTRLVKETAERLGYHKNNAARWLKTKKSMSLGILVADISNPIFASFYKSIEKVCAENNYILILSNSNEESISEYNIIKNMLEYGVDGLFLIPSMENASIFALLQHSNIPYIFIQRDFEDFNTISVQSNDYEGGYLAAQHLYSLGHRSFLFVTAPFYISSAKDRYNGFLAYLKEKGLSYEDVEIIECAGTRDTSNTAMLIWLETKKQNSSATAIFCFSDYVAYGVYSAFIKHDIKIPDDYSIIGYDNNEFSSIVTPNLTTIDLLPAQVGEQAAKLMIDMLSKNKNYPSKQISIHPKLVIRESTTRKK